MVLPGACIVSSPAEPPDAGSTSCKTKQKVEERWGGKRGGDTAETYSIPSVPSKNNVLRTVAHSFNLRKAETGRSL